MTAVVIVLRDGMPTGPWAIVGYTAATGFFLAGLVFIGMAIRNR